MKLFNKFIDKDLLSVGEGKNKLSVFSLALPIFFESIGVHLIGLVQSAMSAHYEGGFFVTVTAIPSTILSLFLNVIAMITTGMSIILSITLGRGQNSNCKKIIGKRDLVSCGLLFVAATTVAYGYERQRLRRKNTLRHHLFKVEIFTHDNIQRFADFHFGFALLRIYQSGFYMQHFVKHSQRGAHCRRYVCA